MILPDIRSRDVYARLASFSTSRGQIVLPGIIDPFEGFPSLKNIHLANVPMSAKEGYPHEGPPVPENIPAIIHPADTTPSQNAGLLMVANWHTLLLDPHRYVRFLYRMKSLHPPDTVWYAPAAALPSNLHILVYSGFDLFDWTLTDLYSAQGFFCLPEGIFPGEMMEQGVCTCDGCRTGDISLHNRSALAREASLIRQAIRTQQLRDLVESRSRLTPAHVSIFRLMDQEYSQLEKMTPVARKGVMRASSGESLSRPEVRRFMERVLNRYTPPRDDVAVLLPCSAKKPYSLSQSHQKYIRAVDRRAHEIILTSPLGVVPRELELCYPASQYDVPVTGYWDHEERHIISEQVAAYFTRNRYRRVILHLDGDASIVARAGLIQAGIPFECTAKSASPTDPGSLEILDQALMGERKRSVQLLRGMCSWQFGLLPDTTGLVMEGRYPWVRFMKKRQPWFGIDQGNGLVRPTIDGWSLIGSGYRVYIDSFDPKGDILAPGVVEADPCIREADEVLVLGDGIRATGRASMNASEMVRSRRGVAVRVRKVKREGTQK